MKLSELGSTPQASRRARVALFTGATAGLCAFSAMLLWLAFLHVGHEWYDPVGRTWVFAVTKPAPAAMDFYSKIGIALLTSGVSASVVGVLARRFPPPERILQALGIWALGFTILGVSWYGYSIGTRKLPPPQAVPSSRSAP